MSMKKLLAALLLFALCLVSCDELDSQLTSDPEVSESDPVKLSHPFVEYLRKTNIIAENLDSLDAGDPQISIPLANYNLRFTMERIAEVQTQRQVRPTFENVDHFLPGMEGGGLNPFAVLGIKSARDNKLFIGPALVVNSGGYLRVYTLDLQSGVLDFEDVRGWAAVIPYVFDQEFLEGLEVEPSSFPERVFIYDGTTRYSYRIVKIGEKFEFKNNSASNSLLIDSEAWEMGPLPYSRIVSAIVNPDNTVNWVQLYMQDKLTLPSGFESHFTVLDVFQVSGNRHKFLFLPFLGSDKPVDSRGYGLAFAGTALSERGGATHREVTEYRVDSNHRVYFTPLIQVYYYEPNNNEEFIWPDRPAEGHIMIVDAKTATVYHLRHPWIDFDLPIEQVGLGSYYVAEDATVYYQIYTLDGRCFFYHIIPDWSAPMEPTEYRTDLMDANPEARELWKALSSFEQE